MVERVTTTDMNQYTVQAQYQYRHRYHKGTSQGMGALMTQLTPEQRQEVSQLLQSIPQEVKPQVKEELLQLVGADLSQQELYEKITAILNNYLPGLPSGESSLVDIYA